MQTDKEIKKEEWSEKDYIDNLYYLIGKEFSKNQWVLLLGIIQGKINHEKDILQEEYKKELIEKIEKLRVEVLPTVIENIGYECALDEIINIIKQ